MNHINPIGDLYGNLYESIVIPARNPYGIQTLNKMGYMATALNSYAEKFIAYVPNCKKPVLEIGPAYGVASLKALSKGATVVSNDLDSNHLKILEHNCPEEDKNRLTTKVGNFLEVDLANDSFQAILTANVIHFMDGDTLRKALSRCYDILEKKGKLFIAANTPYLKELLSFLPIFEQKLQDQEEWPGLIEDVYSMGYFNDFPNIPNLLHCLDVKTLKRELEQANFYVEEISYFRGEDYPDFLRLDGRECVGAVAIKL